LIGAAVFAMMNGNGAHGCNGNGSSMGPGGLPKLREILRRQKADSDDEESTPDIEFCYSDSDSLGAEMAEFYSYTENPEFPSVHRAYQECMDKFGVNENWR
jgi:hypothetical protein